MQTKTNPTKDRLIKAGAQAMLVKSYHAVGIQEILETTDVPKGSFYYYFKSKEEFAQAILEYQAEKTTDEIRHSLSSNLAPRRRLKEYFRAVRQEQLKNNYSHTCLLIKLAGELGNTVPAIRHTIKTQLDKRLHIIAESLAETENSADAARIAETIYMAWEGALIKANIDQTVHPLDTFLNHTFERLLPEKQTSGRHQEAPL